MWIRLALVMALVVQVDGARISSATVSGIVRDSIARGPLIGAMVQIVAADDPAKFGRTVVTDSSGAFNISDVPDGRYMLGFYHAMLDSLGLEPTVREVSVSGGRAVRADLAIPSPARLRATICGAAARDSGGILLGVVRDAHDGTPRGDVSVVAEWLEMAIGAGGISQRVPHLTAKTAGNGWFAMCNVPMSGTVMLSAVRGADSTDVIEAEIPVGGFLRRELFVGPARRVVVVDTLITGDTLHSVTRRTFAGDMRLSGTVVASLGGGPLPGAVVGVVNGPQTRANERGEWTLTDVPPGTRMLEVRAISYYPLRRAIDIVKDAAPVRVALLTMRAVMDTVRVSVSGRTRLSPGQTGFEERRRTGAGQYFTRTELDRKRAIVLSDLLRNVRGLMFEDTRIIMRAAVGDVCDAEIFFNGQHMRFFDAENVDLLASPKEVTAIEVYVGATTPIQFQPAEKSGCGSILIWTR
jgi:hypothetical protein